VLCRTDVPDGCRDDCGSAIRDRLTSTYSVGVMQLGSLCGSPAKRTAELLQTSGSCS
jgi:hypothetical protein